MSVVISSSSSSTSSTQPVVFTCITCKLTFKDGDIMRAHYKTDLHRFNLKRKVANLPPVTEELFNKKLADLQDGTDNPQPKQTGHIKKNKKEKQSNIKFDRMVSKEQPSSPDYTRKRSISDPGAEVKEKEEEGGGHTTDSHMEDQSQITEEQLIDQKISSASMLTLEDSLFDRHKSNDFLSNINYMTKHYGFFIPEFEYLKDLPGLFRYLAQKIAVGNCCIYCEKSFYSLEATQNHMRSVSHCKILWEDNEQEYADYYDLDEADKRFNVSESSTSESTYVSQANELVLVDKNKVLGHRALQVYYKQRPHSSAQLQLMTSLMQEHKRLASIEHQKNTNLSKKGNRIKADQSLKLGMKNNNQQHYRNKNPL
eukprot:TRINITY_DN4293_c0_g2_i1.p1 TRINITY_DN4293_c0_g2~~TRINITY_DN4293_c0_g2_i1.p1  ORF type:complete len:392 (+),score=57.03 TRINITY_DN4293_c0_g2_i1:71-1177(+)